ncbi:MAG: STAS domain-containing protein [Janthinobacterium lividum]
MIITTQATATILTLLLEGELDASSSVLLDAALEQPTLLTYEKVLVNFQRLSYISSAGIGVFIAHLPRLQHAGVKLVLFNLSEKVLNVFEILGLDALLHLAGTEHEALAR